jgi:hypothetical protein
MSEHQIPQEFICPITLSIMDDPVICSDSYTYERSAILQLRNSISPITRQYIDKNNLITNRAIKDSIERFKQTSGIGSLNHNPSSSNFVNIQTCQNPQLVIPQYNNLDYYIRSPWNDKIYNLKFKNPINFTNSRVATTFIAVLDTSGSMGESCSTGGEADGFTRLNLLQHSMNTLIEMLNQGDELVMVQFNSTANYIFKDKINQFNKPLAKSAIDALNPGGGTYIWNGLRLAYDAASIASNTNVHIMLLTDGQSNDDPFTELKRYFSSNPSKANLKSIKLTTFGFSYDINSKILFDIAEYTNAGFNFIPDASMVGTTFCNYLANILSPDISVPEITCVDLSGSTNDNFEITTFESLSIAQEYELIRYHCYEILKQTCFESGTSRRLNSDITDRINNFKLFIQCLQSGMINDSGISIDTNNGIRLFQSILKDFVSEDDSQEQITKAIQRQDWFNKWGYHYLLSLSLAHLTRQCHNFKDQGVQLYGSSLFGELNNQVYQIFSTIQPPRPSLRAQVVRTSMSAYVDRSGGCFGSECRIKLADGSWKKLSELDGNELVFQGDGIPGSQIKYIVQTEIPEGTKYMCKINDLIISEYHPMFDSNSNGWVFPINLIESQEISLSHMYNIVLESGHWVNIEGFKCVSLAHGLTNFDPSNQILKHDYFGTNKIIQDLENFSLQTCSVPKNSKIITIKDYNTIRDPVTNLVIGIKSK